MLGFLTPLNKPDEEEYNNKFVDVLISENDKKYFYYGVSKHGKEMYCYHFKSLLPVLR